MDDVKNSDQCAREELSKLVKLAFNLESVEPHFVLLSPPNIKGGPKGWAKIKPTLGQVLNHLSHSENRIGLVPRSLNLGTFDYDGDSDAELKKFTQQLKPICSIKTAGGEHRHHLILHLSSDEMQKHKKARKPKDQPWDLIVGNNYTLIHDGGAAELSRVLEETRGMPRTTDLDRDIGAVTKKSKSTKSNDKSDKVKPQVELPTNVDLSDPMGKIQSKDFLLSGKDSDSQKVEHIFSMFGHHLVFDIYRRHTRIKLLSDKDNPTKIGKPFKKMKSLEVRDMAHKHFCEKVAVGKEGQFELRPMKKFSIVEWDAAISAIESRNSCDFFLDWLVLNARSYSEVSPKATLNAIEERLPEFFDIHDLPEAHIRHGSGLPYYTFVLRRFHPGLPVAHHLAIFGDSRAGKSTYARGLIPPEFDGYVLPKLDLLKEVDKLVYDLEGQVLAELSEMGNTRRADNATVKGILAEGKLVSRLVWERTRSEVPLTHATIATANLDEKPLPEDIVTASRFWVVPIKKKPHQEKKEGDREGYIETIAAKGREKIIAYVVHHCERLGLINTKCPIENAKLRGRAQAFIMDPPHSLREFHLNHISQFQYRPTEKNDSIADRIREWLYSQPSAINMAKRLPKSGEAYFTGREIEDGVPEFKKLTRGRDKVLESLGFKYRNPTLGETHSGERIRPRVWVLSREAENKNRATHSALSREPVTHKTFAQQQGKVIPIRGFIPNNIPK